VLDIESIGLVTQYYQINHVAIYAVQQHLSEVMQLLHYPVLTLVFYLSPITNNDETLYDYNNYLSHYRYKSIHLIHLVDKLKDIHFLMKEMKQVNSLTTSKLTQIPLAKMNDNESERKT
jgi:hypothetical protein